MARFEGDNAERQAIKVITQHGNTVSAKKISLLAERFDRDKTGMPGVKSAGLKLWSAIDFLVGQRGYLIQYEVQGEKKK